uniref:AlNc14C183G8262 protein n=1 Tax=Albugo laibachii Nc14 TaxID=890382 RepID=F0WPB3_9STRA|nr:AlNc14C183G8262 [Albugo laibachii Nc14]|eukprot:CCA23160.1 AlNc14C183G8262 [Albugo laibachii Nc14]
MVEVAAYLTLPPEYCCEGRLLPAIQRIIVHFGAKIILKCFFVVPSDKTSAEITTHVHILWILLSTPGVPEDVLQHVDSLQLPSTQFQLASLDFRILMHGRVELDPRLTRSNMIMRVVQLRRDMLVFEVSAICPDNSGS